MVVLQENDVNQNLASAVMTKKNKKINTVRDFISQPDDYQLCASVAELFHKEYSNED